FVAERGADARAQLADFVGFGNVIHRAQFETTEFIGGAVPRSQDDDGDASQVRILFQLAQHGETVVLREAEVQQDEVDLVAPRQRQPVAPFAGAQKPDLVLLEAGGEQMVQILVVINQQNLWPGGAHCLAGEAQLKTTLVELTLHRIYWLSLFLLKNKTNTSIFLGDFAEQFLRLGQLPLPGNLFQFGAQSGQPARAEVAGASLEAVRRFLQRRRVGPRDRGLHALNLEGRVAQEQVNQLHRGVRFPRFLQVSQAVEHCAVNRPVAVVLLFLRSFPRGHRANVAGRFLQYG